LPLSTREARRAKSFLRKMERAFCLLCYRQKAHSIDEQIKLLTAKRTIFSPTTPFSTTVYAPALGNLDEWEFAIAKYE